MSRFWRRKKGEASARTEKVVITPLNDLRKLCGSDEELYFTLERTLLFRVPPSALADQEINEALARAETFNTAGDKTSARVQYKRAGDLAIFKGNLEETRRHYEKALEVDPDWQGKKILDYFLGPKADKAMKVAAQYYSKFKTEERIAPETKT